MRRADELADEGLITNQVIQRLIDGDLVVADLTGRNANVYYELAIRHAAQKPVIHLIEHGETLPFDVANVRAIAFALSDPDLLDAARAGLQSMVSAIEASPRPADNPIHAALRLQALRASEVPQSELAGEILEAIGDMRVQLQALVERTRSPSMDPPVLGAGKHARRLGGVRLRPGDRVRHDRFGPGEVIEVQPDGIVIIDFGDEARKMVPDMAPMDLIIEPDDDDDDNEN